MKSRSIRVLAALIATGIMAGSAEAHVAAGPKEAATPAREGIGVRERDSSPMQSPLGLSVQCDWRLQCTAHAQGGTGTYVSWKWEGAVDAYDDGGNWSTADAGSVCVPGYYWGVLVTVTDSSGATRTESIMVYCPEPSYP